jgi:transposase
MKNGVIKELTPQDRPYYTAEDVKEILGVSISGAYNIIRRMRDECVEQGLISEFYPKGKIPKKYFNKACMIE